LQTESLNGHKYPAFDVEQLLRAIMDIRAAGFLTGQASARASQITKLQLRWVTLVILIAKLGTLRDLGYGSLPYGQHKAEVITGARSDPHEPGGGIDRGSRSRRRGRKTARY
jgi:hypothetical protein